MTSLIRAQKRLLRQRYGYKRNYEFNFSAFCEHNQILIVIFMLGIVCLVDSFADFLSGSA